MSKSKYILIFLLLLSGWLLPGCSSHPDNKEALKAKDSSADSGSFAAALHISPAEAAARAVIKLDADRSLLNRGEVQWFINDVRNETARGFQFYSDKLKKDDVVHAVILKDKKEYASNRITIRNTPPVIHAARILPQAPSVTEPLTVEISASDEDKDPVSYSYRWQVNGKYAGDYSFLESGFKRDDLIEVVITPHDGEVSGKSIRLKTKIVNSLPVFSESNASFDGKTYVYPVKAEDPDGDALAYNLEQAPDGMTIDSSGIITWDFSPENAGRYDISVSISDNHGGKIIVPITTRIAFEEGEK